MSQKNENPNTTANGEIEESKDPAEMSLAELLGSSAEIPIADAAPRRVDYREDEPASGVVKLAAMVEASNVETIASNGYLNHVDEPMPEERTTTHPIVTSTIPAAKSNKALPIFVTLGVVAAAALLAVTMVNGQKGELTEKQLAQLEELAQLRAEKTALENSRRIVPAAAPVPTAAIRAEHGLAGEQPIPADQGSAEATTASAPIATKTANVVDDNAQVKTERETGSAAEAQPAAPDIDRSEKVAAGDVEKESNKTSRRSSSRSRRERRGNGASTASVTEREPVAAVPAATAEEPVKSKTHELDALLGGSPKRPQVTNSAPAATSDQTDTPSKAVVRSAMNPVVAKAKSCSRFSTGTVQLKVTVGSNGRVQESSALGSFANTTAGKCVEMMARTAKFPKFSEPSFTFTYPVVLR